MPSTMICGNDMSNRNKNNHGIKFKNWKKKWWEKNEAVTYKKEKKTLKLFNKIQ